MRRLLSSLVTSGGLLAAIAFFLPWVSVSCNGALITTVSPHERAAGIAVPDDLPVGGRAVDEAAPKPEPGYWALLLPAILLAAVGALLHLGAWDADRSLGAAACVTAFAGLWLTTSIGLRDRLGLGWPDVAAPGLTLTMGSEIGAFVSLGAYVLALSGGLAAIALAGRIDRPEWR